MVTAVDRFFRQTLTLYTALYLIAVVLSLIAIALIIRTVVRGYRRYSGLRTVTCPETKEQATVLVEARHVVESWLFGRAGARIVTCSRWPEHADCGHLCVTQIGPATPTR